MTNQSIVTITHLKSPHKGRAEVDRYVRIEATHNPFTHGNQIPAAWLREDKVKALARLLVHQFVDEKVNWYDTYLREIREESEGSWIVWIYQEWLD